MEGENQTGDKVPGKPKKRRDDLDDPNAASDDLVGAADGLAIETQFVTETSSEVEETETEVKIKKSVTVSDRPGFSSFKNLEDKKEPSDPQKMSKDVSDPKDLPSMLKKPATPKESITPKDSVAVPKEPFSPRGLKSASKELSVPKGSQPKDPTTPSKEPPSMLKDLPTLPKELKIPSKDEDAEKVLGPLQTPTEKGPGIGDKKSVSEEHGKVPKKSEEAEKSDGVGQKGVPADGATECCAPPCVTLPCNIGGGNGIMNIVSNFPCGNYFGGRIMLNKRNPFKHNPPAPDDNRGRIANPSSLVDYIINLREDLADFQECHGLPRSRDYSFVSLGLALAQESVRAILSIICIFTELFPILAILSLILRFALDKLIDILQTADSSQKIKKLVIFTLEMLIILIPLWLLVGIIFMPLITLIISVFRRLFHIKGVGDTEVCCVKLKPKPDDCP